MAQQMAAYVKTPPAQRDTLDMGVTAKLSGLSGTAIGQFPAETPLGLAVAEEVAETASV
jgi:hypothetical protein